MVMNRFIYFTIIFLANFSLFLHGKQAFRLMGRSRRGKFVSATSSICQIGIGFQMENWDKLAGEKGCKINLMKTFVGVEFSIREFQFVDESRARAREDEAAASVTDPFIENQMLPHTSTVRSLRKEIKNYRKMRKIMKTATAADDAFIFSYISILFLWKKRSIEMKTVQRLNFFSCCVINCYHICHLIFLVVPLCIGGKETTEKTCRW